MPGYSASTRTAVEAFLNSYRTAVGSGITGIEMATRPAVHALFVSLLADASDHLDVVHDQFVPGTKNKPDWAVYQANNGGLYFYGDHKPASGRLLSLSTAEKNQMNRYLDMGAKVLVFDGCEFLFFAAPGASADRIGLYGRSHLTSSTMPSQLDVAVLDRLRSWISVPGVRSVSLGELIDQSAMRGRRMREELSGLLALPPFSGTDQAENDLIDNLHGLQNQLIRSGKIQFENPTTCADFVSQILAFGLVYVHFASDDGSDSPSQRALRLGNQYLGLNGSLPNLPPFAEIVAHMGDALGHEDGFLGYWYRDAVRYFSNVRVAGVSAQLDYHGLFESFLHRYDPRVRFDYGAFYTPHVLADWLARQVQRASKEHFGGPVEQVAEQIIDPCCGTGSILEAIVRRREGPSETAEYIGIEIMPVPYALAQFRMSQYADDAPDPPVSLYLADTLDDALLGSDLAPEIILAAEVNGARAHTRDTIRVVAGNPPSVVADLPRRTQSDLALAEFRSRMPTTSRRSNLQQAVNNEAVRFLAWSAMKVLASGHGIVALILPGSLATSASYIGVRRWLVEKFDRIEIVQLDADMRTGMTTESIFNTQQGRLALIATLDPTHSTGLGASVLVHDISGLPRSQKLAFLADESEIPYGSVAVEVDREVRFALARADSIGWAAGSAIFGQPGETDTVFINRSSGVKLAPTLLLFHTDPAMLQRRSLDISARSTSGYTKSVDALLARWSTGQVKPISPAKLVDSVRAAIGASIGKPAASTEYTFRPFVAGRALLDRGVLAALTPLGDGTRARAELQSAYKAGAIGIAIAPDPVALGDSLDRFAAFAWTLPDNDLVARGNAMIYPDIWSPIRGPSAGQALSNLHPTSAIRQRAASDRDALFYTYAMLSSNWYRTTFHAELFRSSSAGAFPRIPEVDGAHFADMVELGWRLAELENLSVAPILRQAVKEREAAFAAQVATWPVEFDVVRGSVSAGGVSLSRLNQADPVELSGVPPTVLAHRIAGHDVVTKWLREREFAYLRRAFRRSDADQLIDVLTRIEEQVALIGDVDTVLASASG